MSAIRPLSIRVLLLLSLIAVLLLLAPSAVTPRLGAAPVLDTDAPSAGLNFIFDSDTPQEYVSQVYAGMPESAPEYNLDAHWNPASTARNNGGAAQGDPLVLTWSIIPDGTVMPSQFTGDTTCNSNLIAQMNTRYGAGNWEAEIQEVFDTEWAGLTGNVYVREPTDDGAAWPGSAGVNGVRGDLRIGGCSIDGNSNILAYNFFPSNGDMKIDAPDTFYTSTNLNDGFHNVVSHEHGHGAGVRHVCPVNLSKLMEPFVATDFIGMQHDDIRAGQRHYGDPNEPTISGTTISALNNDTAATATNLGTVFGPVAASNVSIDDDSDVDFYAFTVTAGRQADVRVRPIGLTYLSGPQNADGTCTAGSSVNSLTIHNLNFEIRDSDGTTVLATGNTSAAGVEEALNNVALGAAGVKYIRIFPATATDDVQLFSLFLMVEPVGAATGADCGPVTITPNAAIPDGRPAGTCFNIVVPDNGVVAPGSTVQVAATHTWVGDLQFQLRTPGSSTRLTMLNRPGRTIASFGDDSNLAAANPILFTDAGPFSAEIMGSTITDGQVVCLADGRCNYAPAPDIDATSLANFAALAGYPSQGTWQFCVADHASPDSGTLTSVTLDLACTGVGVLAVELSSFAATPEDNHMAVTWETVAERETLGFNLLRATGPDVATATRINSALIPATGGGQSAAYAQQDADVAGGTTYFYWLEAVDTDGTTSLHGPTSATYEASSAVTLAAGPEARGAGPVAQGLALAGLLLGATGALAWRRRR